MDIAQTSLNAVHLKTEPPSRMKFWRVPLFSKDRLRLSVRNIFVHSAPLQPITCCTQTFPSLYSEAGFGAVFVDFEILVIFIIPHTSQESNCQKAGTAEANPEGSWLLYGDFETRELDCRIDRDSFSRTNPVPQSRQCLRFQVLLPKSSARPAFERAFSQINAVDDATGSPSISKDMHSKAKLQASTMGSWVLLLEFNARRARLYAGDERYCKSYHERVDWHNILCFPIRST